MGNTTTSSSSYHNNSSYSSKENTSNPSSKNSTTTYYHHSKDPKILDTQSHYQVSMASGMASEEFPDMLQALPWIIFMSIFALVLSLVLVIAISKVPKVVIYSLIGFTFFLILAGIVGGFLMGLL